MPEYFCELAGRFHFNSSNFELGARTLTIMRGVFQYPYIQKGRLQPFQGYRNVRDGVKNDLCIQVLY